MKEEEGEEEREHHPIRRPHHTARVVLPLLLLFKTSSAFLSSAPTTSALLKALSPPLLCRHHQQGQQSWRLLDSATPPHEPGLQWVPSSPQVPPSVDDSSPPLPPRKGPRRPEGGGRQQQLEEGRAATTTDHCHHQQEQQQQHHHYGGKRVHGDDVEGVFASLAAISEDDRLTGRDIGDALLRLVNVTATNPQARSTLPRDPRFQLLLQQLAQDHARSLPVNRLAALLNPLYKLSPTSLPAPFLEAIRQRLDQGLHELLPVSLCTVAFCFSRLKYKSHDLAWWQAFVDAAGDRLIDFSSWELCQLLRSLLSLHHLNREALVPSHFLALWVQCCQRRSFSSSPSLSAEEVEVLATSFSKIPPTHYRLPTPFLDRLSTLAAEQMDAFTPLQLCRVYHAFGRIGHNPGSDWLRLYEERAVLAMKGRGGGRYWKQAELALFIQACAWLRYQPSPRLLAAYMEASKTLLQQRACPSVSLGTMLVGLGELRRPPDEEWMEAFLSASRAQLKGMSAKDLGYILKGFAKLQWHPGDEYLDELLSLLQPSLGESSGLGLQLLMTALVALNHKPSPSFTRDFIRAVKRAMPLPSRELCLILWSLAALDVLSLHDDDDDDDDDDDGHPPFLPSMLARANDQLQTEVTALIARQQQQEEGQDRRPSGSSSSSSSTSNRAEKWALVARLRQLRQVLAHVKLLLTTAAAAQQQQQSPPSSSLEVMIIPAGMWLLIEKGLLACGPEAVSMVRTRGAVTPFHAEVRTVLELAGARLEQDVVVSIFKLDLLLHHHHKQQQALPAAAGGQRRGGGLPLLILLLGPNRFLRNRPEQLEAGTAFKVRILQALQGQRFQAVVTVSHLEWAAKSRISMKLDLLKAKVSEKGGRLEDYCDQQQEDEQDVGETR